MLVGNGDHRGVYALNNLTDKDYNYMYDPDDSYGITAGQWWTGSPEDTSESFIEKRLYTFWASAIDSHSLDGVDVKRRVIPSGKKIRYTEAANPSEFNDPPYIVHTAHSNPTDSPTGLGNHTYTDYKKSLKTFFTPSDIPCTKKPQAAGKDAEGNQLYYVTSGVDWYHDRTKIVWSGSAYSAFSKAYATGHGNTKGGYVHRVTKEFLTEYTKDINLMAKNINNKSNPIPNNNSNKITNNNSNNLSNNNISQINIKTINDNQNIERDKNHIFPKKRHRNKSMDDKIGEIRTDTKCKCIIF